MANSWFSWIAGAERPARLAPADELKQPALKPVSLLVIDSGRQAHNWYNEFRGATLPDGRPIAVEQAGWDSIHLSAYEPLSSHPVVLTLSASPNPLPDTPQSKTRTVFPDFLLVRNEVRGVTVAQDHRRVLFGLQYANLPSVNSLRSIYQCLERPWVTAELNRIARKLGPELFPLIPQNYFPGHHDMMYSLPFPAVVKIGHAHAGYGKMRVQDHHAMDDVRSVLALTELYCTCEPFKTSAFDLRVQKIGASYRVFKRQSISSNWKTNTGSSHLEEIPLKPRYKLWADEAALIFDGMDILTVDALVTENGQEFILEVNGTASGLAPQTAAEDNKIIRNLVMQRMAEHFLAPKQAWVRPAGVPTAREEHEQAAAAAASAAEAAAAGPRDRDPAQPLPLQPTPAGSPMPPLEQSSRATRAALPSPGGPPQSPALSTQRPQPGPAA